MLNNNVIGILDDKGKERIVMGERLSFLRSVGRKLIQKQLKNFCTNNQIEENTLVILLSKVKKQQIV